LSEELTALWTDSKRLFLAFCGGTAFYFLVILHKKAILKESKTEKETVNFCKPIEINSKISYNIIGYIFSIMHRMQVL